MYNMDEKPTLFAYTEIANELKLCKLLLKKYAKLINEHERKTVGQLKAMIDKDDLTIRSLAERFCGTNYSFEENFLEAVKRAFEFLCTEIAYVELDISLDFWLTPSEILKHKVSDDEDLAIMLCSIIFALGNERANVVIAELEDMSVHAFVLFEYKGKFYILDPCQRHEFDEFVSTKEEKVFKIYSFKGKKIRRLLYKFNRFEYIAFGE